MNASLHTLPRLRQDLRLEAGQRDELGAPTWLLYDPIRHCYFTLSDMDMKMLSMWGSGSVEALGRAMAQARLVFDTVQLQELTRFLMSHQLVLTPEGPLRPHETAATKLLRLYLGWRIPLWRPAAFLNDTLPAMRLLWCLPVLLCWLVLTGGGIYLSAQQSQAMAASLSGFMNLGGILSYGLALAALKIIHEMGHAYVATHHGCTVSTMGVAVANFMPALYTDTTSACRLASRRARMAIDLAGVAAEGLVAGIALFIWAILPDGTARHIAFLLASAWSLSLLVNLNPLARFDGYYLLADALNMSNLQPRALAMTRWAITRMALGPIDPAPEAATRTACTLWVAYGAAVWLYRIGLCMVSAWLLHAVGLALAAWLLMPWLAWVLALRPCVQLMRTWWQRRQALPSRRKLMLGAVLLALPALLVLPIDTHVSAPAVLAWGKQSPIHAPEASRIVAVHVQPGQHVRQGQVLFTLASPELAIQRARARVQWLSSATRLERGASDTADRLDAQVLARQRAQFESELSGLSQREDLLQLRAPHEGVVSDMPLHLGTDHRLSPRQLLARVIDTRQVDARGYVDAADAHRLSAGAHARFVPDDPLLPSMALSLSTVDAEAARQITPAMLTTRHGGAIAVHTASPTAGADDKAPLRPVTAQHRIIFSPRPDKPDALPIYPPMAVRGEVSVQASPDSVLGWLGRHAWRVLMAELRS